MTWMLASVSGPAEAEVAMAAGADVIDLTDPSDPPLGRLETAAVQQTVQAVAGRCMVAVAAGNAAPGQATVREHAIAGIDLLRIGLFPGPARQTVIRDLAALAGELRLLAVLFADHGEDFDVIERLAEAGFAGVMLDVADKSAGRLTELMSPGRLETFIALCRDKGLQTGLAGGLEAPDISRLMPLKPDFLGFRRALCRGHDRRNGIEPHAVAAIRRLIPPLGGPGKAADDDHERFDRVLVSELVLPVSIGAYRHERDKPQRVRFAVTAAVTPRAWRADDVDEVFSYDVIVDAIRTLVANRHVTLVETLAEDIAAAVLQHPQVREVTVRVEKLDVGPAIVGVEIVRRTR